MYSYPSGTARIKITTALLLHLCRATRVKHTVCSIIPELQNNNNINKSREFLTVSINAYHSPCGVRTNDLILPQMLFSDKLI